MRRIPIRWEAVTDFMRLRAAALRSARAAPHSPEVQHFMARIEDGCFSLQRALRQGVLAPKLQYSRVITTPVPFTQNPL